jgi:hypothetical protein
MQQLSPGMGMGAMMHMQPPPDSALVMMRLLDEAKAERAEAKAERVAMQEQLIKLSTPRPAAAAIDEQQIAALYTRLESLQASKLLTDGELTTVEDLIADWVEAQASMVDQVVTEAMLYASGARGATLLPGRQVHKMLKLSAALGKDAAFARQIRRKLL